MGRRRSRLGYRSLVAALGVALVAGPVAGSPAAAPAPVRGAVRVDQGGYAPGEAKGAFLLAEAPAGGARFEVVDAAGRTVLSGRVGRATGGWNGRYRAVHPSTSAPCDGPAATRSWSTAWPRPRRRSGWPPAGPCSVSATVREGRSFGRDRHRW